MRLCVSVYCVCFVVVVVAVVVVVSFCFVAFVALRACGWGCDIQHEGCLLSPSLFHTFLTRMGCTPGRGRESDSAGNCHEPDRVWPIPENIKEEGVVWCGVVWCGVGVGVVRVV